MSAAADAKIRMLLPVLGSDQSGEVVAAAAAIGRLLEADGLDWHALADRLAGPADTTAPRPAAGWHDRTYRERRAVLASLLACRCLTEWESEFVRSLHSLLSRRDVMLSERQAAVLDELLAKAAGCQR